ncbi:FecR domain-containing protein [uncultured Desulfosarcina sp.]|uniref:FecR family protein n=1 Tax=uncultured Desulfosarcina sp. TaxID=218289 RepID=UPI0029C77BC0|nr:FecR domain-containing protein [uncultured Desulfosarcina sp.]
MGLDMMHLKSTLLLFVFFPAAVVLGFHSAPAAAHTVAEIASIKGTVHLNRSSGENRLAVGFRLMPGDILETGVDGSLGLVFDDDTRLSMGPDSRLKIEEFVFDPGKSEFSFIVRMFKGTVVYVSGLIAKISPKATKFITPTASIGIRGTRFAVHVEEIKS